MAYIFGDGFDLYAALTDAYAAGSYWDATSTTNASFVAGRFTGSRAIAPTAASGILVKTSGVNDAVHHLVVAYQQTSAITGSSLGGYLELFDGATAQCSVVFRSDGAILLASGGPTGTVLATYTSAVTATNTWYGFEFEIVINNTTGAFRVRKNGNTSNDFDSGSIDTQNSANAYANKLQTASQTGIGSVMDDLLWRSDAAAVAWMGDVRCYTRMPSGDASVQFSRVPTSNTQIVGAVVSTTAVVAGRAQYSPFTAAYDGTIGIATVTMSVGYTGNMKCSIFASSGGVPTTVLGSATNLVNPATGSNTFTFGTPVVVTKGTQYWIGFDSDTSSGTWQTGSGVAGWFGTTAYASFPVASPASLTGAAPSTSSVTIAISSNATVVSEAQQDALTSYVYDSTVGHNDLYTLPALASGPTSVVAVTTIGYFQKSDAGTRNAAMQLKSGATTVQSTSTALSPSGWSWLYRNDLVDPNTSAAWAPSAVDSLQIGPVVTA
jgi:hypothetical protein